MDFKANEVKLVKQNTSLGLQVGDPKEGKAFPFVKQLKDDSVAKELLQVNDYIVSVNGKSMEGLPYSAVHAEVRATPKGAPLTFMVRQSSSAALRRVSTIKRGKEPLPVDTGSDYAVPTMENTARASDYRESSVDYRETDTLQGNAAPLYEEPVVFNSAKDTANNNDDMYEEPVVFDSTKDTANNDECMYEEVDQNNEQAEYEYEEPAGYIALDKDGNIKDGSPPPIVARRTQSRVAVTSPNQLATIPRDSVGACSSTSS